ncbi:MAG TPA: tRNA pseudouridine(55) synthase TruB [Ignavibacteriales bacterium]|nr:tRNA pseudouridine(55) synthase TruB [Ignavibacteriales bacterium]
MITKHTDDFSLLDFSEGETLLIDKPPQWTSFKVVYKIKKAINIRRVGHTGTLDPLATGLLIILTGKSTKKMLEFQNLDKTYEGIITLGKTSPSMDTETEITENDMPEDLTEEKILSVRNQFLGEIVQVPPMYSALKVKGQKLYHLARKGKVVKREPRKVYVSKFEIKKIDLPDIHFEIRCSKGTYIRVIANDFGEKLGCGAVLSSLRRTEIGDYNVNDALRVKELIQKVGSMPQLEKK